MNKFQISQYKQLELFDLQAYTSKQIAVDDSKVMQMKAKQQEEIEYKQLELDLFPLKQSNNEKEAA